MTRLEEVARLRELEKKARYDQVEHGAPFRAFMARSAPWSLEVLACFQPGDARKIDAFFRDCMCPDSELPNDCSMCDDDTIDFCNMFRRFQKAAEIMEGQE